MKRLTKQGKSARRKTEGRISIFRFRECAGSANIET